MNRFHETPITDRATGHTFMHPSYCETPAEAAAYARLTFTNPAVYAVGEAAEPVVKAAQEYSEAWNPDHPGWSQPLTEPAGARVQTELF